MNILILTGRFGMGHYSVAHALQEQLLSACPSAHITVHDIFADAFGGRTGLLYKAYTLFISRGGKIYNQIYRRAEQSGDAVGIPLRPVFLRTLGHILTERHVDAVISTLPFTSQLMSEYKTRYGDHTPLITCITDVSIHGDWLAPETDAYLVAAERTRAVLTARGAPRSRVFVTGVPVRPGFTPSDRVPSVDKREVLITGGGLGLLPDNIGFYRALNAMPGLHTTVICGSNTSLRERLKGRFENITALGFVPDMENYLRHSDLIVGKPGGVSVFEAIACRVPFLSFRPFLAQEVYNAGYISAEGLGAVLECEPRQCVEQLYELAFDDVRLAEMRRNMDRQVSLRDSGVLHRLLHGLERAGCCA